MGSGKLISRAIRKYGIKNFRKEILFVFDNEEEMNSKEKELVTLSEDSYNLCPGGQGGFGFINKNGLRIYGSIRLKELYKDPEWKRKFSENARKRMKKYDWEYRTIKWKESMKKYSSQNVPGTPGNITRGMLGKKHSQETKEIMSLNSKGSNNSQHGTMWVTNGSENKKINKKDVDFWIQNGYNAGRIINRKEENT